MPVHVKRALLVTLFGLAVLGSAAHADDPDGEVKLSLPTESDRVAWVRPGFRLGLGLDYGELVGLRGAPSGRELGVNMHAGLRLDEDWSLLVSFDYGRVSSNAGISGLRYAGTLDPTWHVTRAFSLAFGFGFGGFVEGSTGRPDDAQQATDVSITLPNASPPIPKCAGVGAAGLLRASYAWVMGPRSPFTAELVIVVLTAITASAMWPARAHAQPIDAGVDAPNAPPADAPPAPPDAAAPAG